MIKVEATEQFILEKFNELKNIKRNQPDIRHKDNMLYYKDTFECDEKMADYLTGHNPINRAVVKVIEVIPEKENTEKKTTTHRRKKPVAQK